MGKRREKENYKFDENFLTPADRPKNRSECANIPRPCPYVSCKYHLGLDVHESGAIKVNFKKENSKIEEVDFDRMHATCALDLADQGGMDLEQIGFAFGLTRERIRQIIEEAFEKIKNNVDDEVIKILFSFHQP